MWFKFNKAKAKEAPPTDEFSDVEDFNWDEEFDGMSDPSLEDEGNRNPIALAVKGGAQSLKSKLKSRSFYEKNVEKILPSEYGGIKTNVEPFTKGMKQLYNETTKEIKPDLKEIASNINKLIPNENKKVKDFYNKVIEKIGLKENQYYSSSSQQSREADMAKSMEEIFNKQKSIDEAREAKQNSEENIEKAIDAKRFKSNIQVLSSINDSLSSIRQFNEGITYNYYKKSLELQYRHYFVMQDVLETNKKHYAESIRHFMAISKNTALPEIQKIRLDESLKEKARDSLLNKTIFGDQSYVQRGIANFKDRMKDKLNNLNKGVSSANQAVSGIVQGAEMGEGMGMSKASMIGDFGMSFLVDEIMSRINKKASERVFSNSDEGIYGKIIDINRYTSNLPGLMEKLSGSNKFDPTSFDETKDYGKGLIGFLNKNIQKSGNKVSNLAKGGIRELIDSFNNAGLENELSSGKDADAFIVERGWDGRDKRTLNYVIPGYLARILQTTTMMVTGKEAELVTYDHTKATFSKESDIANHIKKELLNIKDKNSYESKLNASTNIITKDSQLSDKTKEQLKKQLADIVKTKRNFDGASLINNEEFLSKFDPEVRDEVNNALVDTFGQYATNTKRNQLEFSKQMKETKDSIANPNSAIDLFAKAGHLDIMEKMGITKKDFFGKAKINNDKILEMMTQGNLDISEYENERLITSTYYEEMPKKTDRVIELLEKIQENTAPDIVSDINAKTDIKDKGKNKNILDRFKKIKVFNWMYKKDKEGKKHDGPMAQQLNSLFGDDVAPNGTSIDMASMNAINIEAIQELYDRQLSMEEQKELDGFDKSIDVLKSIKKDTAKISSTLQALTKLNIDLVKLTNQMASSGMFSGMFSFGGNGSYSKYTGDDLRDRINRAFSKEGSDKVFDYIKAGLGRGKKAIDEVSDVTKKYGTKAGKFTWDKTAGLRKYLFGLQSDKKVKEGETPLKDRSLVGDIKQYGPEVYTKLKDSFFDTTEWLGRKLSDTKDFIKPRAGNILSKSYNFLKDKALDLYNKPIDIYNKLDPTTPLLSARLMEMGAYFDKKTNQVIKNLSDIKGEVIDSEGRVVLTLEDIKIGLVDSEGIAIKLGVTKLPSLLKAGAAKVGSKLLQSFMTLSDGAKNFGDSVREWFSSSFSGIGSGKSEEYLLQIRDMLNDRLPGERTNFISGDINSDDFVGPKKPFNFKDKVKASIDRITPNLDPKYKSGNIIDTMMGMGTNLRDRFSRNNHQDDEFIGPQRPNDRSTLRDRYNNLKDNIKNRFNRNNQQEDFVGPQQPNAKRSILQRSKDAVGNATGVVGGTLSSIASGVGGVMGALASNKQDDNTDKQNNKEKQTTEENNDSLMKKLLARLSPSKKGDRDGDGDVDGGFDDIEERREKLKEERMKDRKIAEVDLTPKYKSKENIIDTIIRMVSGVGGGAASALGGAADAAGAIGDMMPDGSGPDRNNPNNRRLPNGRKPGLMSRAWTGTKNVLGKVGAPIASLATSSGLLGKLGALRSGLMAAGLAVPGVAGAATGAAGLVTSALTGILASPVAVGALVAGGVGIAGYAGYKYLTRNSIEDIDIVRMRQYGLTDEDSSNYHLILDLEQHLMETAVAYNNKQAFLNQDGIKVEEILNIFDIDKEDPDRTIRFTKWFNGRFKPVFIAHLSALAKINPKYKLDEVDDLSDKEKYTYLETIEMPSQVYTVTDSPFEEGQLLATEKDVKDAIAVVKEDLDIPEEDKKKLAEDKPSIKKDDPNTTIAGIATQSDKDKAAEEAKEQSMLSKLVTGLATTTGIGAVYNAFTAIKSLFVEKESKPPIKLSKSLNEIQTIRFHAYGLKQLDIYRCSAIVELESVVEKHGLTFKSDNSSVFNGDFNVVFDKIKTYFGIPKDNKEKYSLFFKWFNERFLPVYLAYVSFGKANTNKTTTSFIDTVLSPSQQAIVAKQITSLDIWSVDFNPFIDDIEMATDSDIVKAYIDSLDKKAKDEEIKKPTVQESNTSNTQTPLYKPQENLAKEATQPTNVPEYGNQSQPTPGMIAGQTGEDGKAPPMVSSTAPVSADGSSSTNAPSTIPMQGGELLAGDGGWDAINSGASKIKNLHPEMLKQVLGAFEEYYKLTGKKVDITDGFRSYQEQADLYRRMPHKAAKPGRSMHEFGLAFDASGKALNEMEKLGIMRKYGLTRPIGGEDWHVEPAYVQTNLALAKSDPNKAAEMIKMSIGRGGGGIGTVPGSKLKSRNTAYAISLLKNAQSTTINTKEQTSDIKPVGSLNDIQDPNLKTAGVGKSSSTQPMQDPNLRTAGVGNTPANPASTSSSYQPSTGGMMQTNAGPSQQGGITKASYIPQQPNISEDGTRPKPITGKSKGSGKVDPGVLDIIKDAANRGGISEDVMIAMAAIESSFNPSANMNSRAKAKGLYQFMPGTWDDMLKKYGHKHGIQPGTSVFDPRANALMAAEYIKENFAGIKKKLPQQPLGPVEAYLSHFLGGSGAAKFLSLPKGDIGAQHMPDAARSNYNIFYDKDNNRPRTVSEIYKHLSDKMHNKASDFGLNINIAGANVMGGTATSSSNPLNTPRIGVSAEQAASGNIGSTAPQGASSASQPPMTADALTKRDSGFTPVSYGSASNTSNSSQGYTSPSIMGSSDPTQVYSTPTSSTGQASDLGSISSSVMSSISTTLTKSLTVQENILKRIDELKEIAKSFNLDGLKDMVKGGSNIINATNVQQTTKQRQQLDKPAVTFERTII